MWVIWYRRLELPIIQLRNYYPNYLTALYSDMRCTVSYFQISFHNKYRTSASVSADLAKRASQVDRKELDRQIVILTIAQQTLLRLSTPHIQRDKISLGFATAISGELCWTSKNVSGAGACPCALQLWFHRYGKREESICEVKGLLFSQSTGFDRKRHINV